MSITRQSQNSYLTLFISFFLSCFLVLITGSLHYLHADTTARYEEALQIIKKHGLYAPARLSGNAASLKKIVQGLDRFSDFLTPVEYTEFLQSQKNTYIGIGAEIEKNNSGEVILLPYPGSPAERAGVKFGDILVAVNEQLINHQSLFLIGAKTRGVKGTTVNVEVQRATGKRYKITIQRQQVHTSTVSLQKKGNFWLLKINRFSPSTKRNLKFALEEISDDHPLVIDIRGNPGGDLNSSIDCAMLFLDKGQKIVDIRRKEGIVEYDSLNASLGLSNQVVVFQDHRTASAAEVFLASLRMNNKAVSIGERTYGKGVVQDIFKLHDGSALFLTTGYLIPPDGQKYHQKGLIADYPLDKKLQNENYWKKIAALFPIGPIVGSAHQQSSTILVSSSNQKRNPSKTEKKSNHVQEQIGNLNHKYRKHPQQFYLCVDKKFNTESDAHKWLSYIINKKKIRFSSSVFQYYDVGTVSWLPCFGPKSGKSLAEKTRRLLTGKLNLPVFTRNFSTADRPVKIISSKSGERLSQKDRPGATRKSLATQSLHQGKKQKEMGISNLGYAYQNRAYKQPSSWQWYIQTGVFLSVFDAVQEIEKIRSSDNSLSVKIYNNIEKKQSGSEKKIESIFLNKDITVIKHSAFNKRTKVHGYRVVIGPFTDINSIPINGLIKRKIIPADSFLLHFQLRD